MSGRAVAISRSFVSKIGSNCTLRNSSRLPSHPIAPARALRGCAQRHTNSVVFHAGNRKQLSSCSHRLNTERRLHSHRHLQRSKNDAGGQGTDSTERKNEGGNWGKSTPLFRVFNPELFMKDNAMIRRAGLVLLFGALCIITYDVYFLPKVPDLPQLAGVGPDGKKRREPRFKHRHNDKIGQGD